MHIIATGHDMKLCSVTLSWDLTAHPLNMGFLGLHKKLPQVTPGCV